MSFLPQLRVFLKGLGVIYTVRKYKMTNATVEVLDVGLCYRFPLGQIKKKEDLDPYVSESGFSTVDDWWRKIREFIPDERDKMYLYKVEVKDERPNKSMDQNRSC